MEPVQRVGASKVISAFGCEAVVVGLWLDREVELCLSLTIDGVVALEVVEPAR